MMKLPDIPTDSMYKFKAIVYFSLLIAMIAVMMTLFLTKKSQSEKNAVITDASFELQAQLISAQIAKIDSIQAQGYADSTQVKDQSKSMENILAWKLELEKKRLEINLNGVESRQIVDNYWLRYNLDSILLIALGIPLALFIINTTRSFREWHLNLQIYQDIKLMREAKINDEEIDAYVKSINKHYEKKTKRKKRHTVDRTDIEVKK